MKIKNLFITLGLAVAATAAIGAGLKAGSVKEAKAATQTITDGTIEIRFTRPSDWGNNTVCIHTWNEGGSGTKWPGIAMTYLWDNEFGESVWSWSPSSTNPLYGSIIFNNNNNGKQSATIDAPSTSKYYYYENSTLTNVNVPTMDIYLYDYDNKFNGSVNVHAWRESTSFANDTWPGNPATKLSAVATNGLIYKFTMSNRYNRVIFSNNGSNQTGDLTPSGNYTYVLANDDTVLSGKNTWWGNINFVLAHNFSENTMLMRSLPTSNEGSTEYCASRYSTAKTAFNALKNSTYGTDVLDELNNNFANAMERLSKWATANHESFNQSTGVFSTNSPLSIIGVSNNNSTLIIVVISALVLVSTGGFFFLRKKQENE